MSICKICNKEFTDRGLHNHIIKAHEIPVSSYYERYYPRYDKMTGKPMSYTGEDYFEKDFDTIDTMNSWLLMAHKEEAKKFLKQLLLKRIKDKDLIYAPSCTEINTTKTLPSYKVFQHFFGCYRNVCEEIGVKPLLQELESGETFKRPTEAILIDTREQQPLYFKNSRCQKLAFGDYTLAGNDYKYIYVDRKSSSDFKSTVTQGFDRFIREIERVKEAGCYLYVVVESSIYTIEQENIFCPHQSNLDYVWSNMRKIQHLFPGTVQFIFSGNRENSQKYIPYLLFNESLKNKDIQSILK